MASKRRGMDGQVEWMVFHVPYSLEPKGVSASAIRPWRMRLAFEEAGFDVFEVSGTPSERAKAIRQLNREIQSGHEPAFVYSESSTMPTPLASPQTFPSYSFMDLSFLRGLRRRGIPVGLFYRDVYWQFPSDRKGWRKLRFALSRVLYKWDLFRYRSAVDLLFLPSVEMGRYLPRPNQRSVAALPPGADIRSSRSALNRSAGVRLAFVGGVGGFYRLHECIRGVALAESAHLTICTRVGDWEAVRGDYEGVLTGNETVVHLENSDLEVFYRSVDIGVLFLEPRGYREFAAPMKLYEYLGAGKPVIATEGSLAAGLVRETGAGWVVPYEAAVLAKLLDSLVREPELVSAAAAKAEIAARHHTWVARAQQASEHLRRFHSMG